MFTIIIPWKYSKERFPLLNNVLTCIEKQDKTIQYQIILVEHVNINDVPPICIRRHHLDHISVSSNQDFNKSWLMNVGAKLAKYPYLVFIDADTIFGNDFFKKIAERIEDRWRVFFCWESLIAEAGRDNPKERIIQPHMTMAMGGIWCIESLLYWNVGGMNENFFGYGGEDNEMFERIAAVIGYLPCQSMMHYTLTHQYHHWVKPSAVATPLFEIGKKYPVEIIRRLKEKNLGQITGPTLIEMGDLK